MEIKKTVAITCCVVQSNMECSSEVTLQLQCLYLETLLEIAGLLGIFLEQGGLFLALRYLIVEPETGF